MLGPVCRLGEGGGDEGVLKEGMERELMKLAMGTEDELSLVGEGWLLALEFLRCRGVGAGRW